MIKNLRKNYKTLLISTTLLLGLFSISANAAYRETVLTRYDQVHLLTTGGYVSENPIFGNITFSNGYAVDHRTYTDATTASDVIKLQSRTRINIIYRTW